MREAEMGYCPTELCRTFDVASSSYYYKPVGLSDYDQRIIIAIKAISAASGQTYGKRRIHAELKATGYTIGIRKTKRLMRVAEITVIVPRKRHYYPDNGTEHKYAANLLARNFSPENPNTHWVGDITYIRTYQGWTYLACVMDLKTKEIVGSAMSRSPNAALAKQALLNAVRLQKPITSNLMFHSDQGTQYSAAEEFRDCLKLLKIKQSMSRRGNCWDNAVMERFFRSLKTERLNQLSFINHQAAITETNNYIYFYNHKRRHSAIGYLTPNQKAYELQKAA